jgi:hypothetical protein
MVHFFDRSLLSLHHMAQYHTSMSCKPGSCKWLTTTAHDHSVHFNFCLTDWLLFGGSVVGSTLWSVALVVAVLLLCRLVCLARIDRGLSIIAFFWSAGSMGCLHLLNLCPVCPQLRHFFPLYLDEIYFWLSDDVDVVFFAVRVLDLLPLTISSSALP